MNLRRVPTRYPLHLHIAALFVVFILALGIVLAWFNYRQNTKIIVAATEQLIEHITENLHTKFEDIYRLAASEVDLLSLSPKMWGATLEDRMRALPLLREALKDAPVVTGIQVGYDNGDYFIARPLSTDYMLERFDAPTGAALVVDSITRPASREGLLTRLFLDQDLRELSRSKPASTSYDPRRRTWYNAPGGDGRVAATPPFLYHFVRKVGITVARQIEETGAVIAADITLDTLSDVLAKEEDHPVRGAHLVQCGRSSPGVSEPV